MILVALLAPAAWGLARPEVDDDLRRAFRADRPEFVRLEQIVGRYGSYDFDIIAILESDDLFTPERIAAQRAFEKLVEERPDVRNAHSTMDGRRLGPLNAPLALFPNKPGDDRKDRERDRAEALRSTIIRGQTLSDDGRTALVLIRPTMEFLDDLDRVAAEIEHVRASAEQTLRPAGVRYRISGGPTVRYEMYAATRRFVTQVLPWSLAATFAALLVLLRSFRAALLVFAAALTAVVLYLGTLGLLGLPLNLFRGEAAAAALLLTLGFGVIRVRGRPGRAIPPDGSRPHHLVYLGDDDAATCLTVLLLFGGVALVGKSEATQFAAAMSMAAMIATAVSIWLLQPLASRLPSGKPSDVAGPPDRLRRAVEAVVARSMRHAKPIAAVGLALVVLGLGALLTAVPDIRIRENVPTGGEVADAIEHGGRAMGGVGHVKVVVRYPEGQSLETPETEAVMRDVQALLLGHGDMRNPLSMVNVVESMPKLGRNWNAIVKYLNAKPRDSLAQFFDLEKREILQTARLADVGSAANEALAETLRGELAALEQKHPGYTFELSGVPMVVAPIFNRFLVDVRSGLLLGACAAALLFGLRRRPLRPLVAGLLVLLTPAACLGLTLRLFAQPYTLGYGLAWACTATIAALFACHAVRIWEWASVRSPPGEVEHERASQTRALSEIGHGLAVYAAAVAAFFVPLLFAEVATRRICGAASLAMLAALLIGQLALFPAAATLLRRPEPTGQDAAG